MDELKWLYMELYKDEEAFAYFLEVQGMLSLEGNYVYTNISFAH